MSDTGSALHPHNAETAVCTLFEGDYHLGLAAFVNSLVRAGFAGDLWAGYRGPLPPWTARLEPVPGVAHAFRVAGQLRIIFLKLDTSIHLTNYKPDFMLRLLAGEARAASYLWYFDPDIFLQSSWAFFSNWQRHGIALCQEIVDNVFPADAPLRRQWMQIAAGLGLHDPRAVNHYYNAGMVGVPAAAADFLEQWSRLILCAQSLGCDLGKLAHGSRENPFNIVDQDALNIAVMYARHPLSTLGPQGMGFIYGASTAMHHAVGQKPWRGSFLARALRGSPPSAAMKSFLAHADAPIRAYAPLQLRGKRLACALATLIGRFYRRA